jgi:hypothetical protein
LHLY